MRQKSPTVKPMVGLLQRLELVADVVESAKRRQKVATTKSYVCSNQGKLVDQEMAAKKLRACWDDFCARRCRAARHDATARDAKGWRTSSLNKDGGAGALLGG